MAENPFEAWAIALSMSKLTSLRVKISSTSLERLYKELLNALFSFDTRVMGSQKRASKWEKIPLHYLQIVVQCMRTAILHLFTWSTESDHAPVAFDCLYLYRGTSLRYHNLSLDTTGLCCQGQCLGMITTTMCVTTTGLSLPAFSAQPPSQAYCANV